MSSVQQWDWRNHRVPAMLIVAAIGVLWYGSHDRVAVGIQFSPSEYRFDVARTGDSVAFRFDLTNMSGTPITIIGTGQA